MKKLIAFMLAIIVALNLAQKACASEWVDTLQETPPEMYQENVGRGANPPGKYADIHDLSVSNYEYQVTDMGAAVYTSKWITGASSIRVTVLNWTVLSSSVGATNNEVTVSVYDSNKTYVTGSTFTINSALHGWYCELSGLNSSSKYYVRFSVPLNGNRYSFNGAISSN